MDAEASGIWRSLPAGGGQKPLLVWLRDKQASSKIASSAAGRISQGTMDRVSCSPDIKDKQPGFQKAKLGVTPLCAQQGQLAPGTAVSVCHSALHQTNGMHPAPAHSHQSRAAEHAAASNGLSVW